MVPNFYFHGIPALYRLLASFLYSKNIPCIIHINQLAHFQSPFYVNNGEVVYWLFGTINHLINNRLALRLQQYTGYLHEYYFTMHWITNKCPYVNKPYVNKQIYLTAHN